MNDQPRFRFTIRDLIALTTIAALGAALLVLALPQINEPRGPSHRAQCINNQRQVATAILTDATRSGYFVGYRNDLGGNAVSWPVRILPQLGRSDIYEHYLQTGGLNPAGRIDVLICPADKSKQVPGRSLSYVLNAGCATIDEDEPANGIGLDCTRSAEGTSLSYVAQHDGVSTTLLLSENIQATTWDVPSKLDTVFLWQPTTAPKPERLINGGPKNAPLSRDTARPSSYHSGGVVMTFCDGRTRFLSDEMDYKVYMQLMTPNGKESDMPAEWKGYAVQETALR